MHIFLNSLRYALWLVFCLFRHAVFVPAAFGGVWLLAWLVFGHPVSDLNDQLQKEATAWRTAPPGHYMWEECPVPDNAAPPDAKPAACTVTAVSTETAANNYLLSLRAVWIIFSFCRMSCMCSGAYWRMPCVITLSPAGKPAPQRGRIPAGPTVKS
ncbi:hypothetical protein [Cronobacter sakazakii]|uniref:hypothetical protein n=1 Tax=Cronobacter sakazakii TaxID=28141 RepID=UPI001FD84998|nr:hypothetical protein [Cronobacter sakazakii]